MPQLAFIMLGGDGRDFTAESLAGAWRRLFPSEDPLPDLEGDGQTFVFPFMGSTATVSHMPGPYPWSDLEGPAETAWRWPGAVDTLKAHRTHLLVGILQDDQPSVARSIKLTLLTAAAIAATAESTAVYWGEGTNVLPAQEFLESAQSMTPDDLPLLSWVEFRIFRTEGGWNLFTTGMTALGVMDIEVRDSTTAPETLFDRVFNIAHYLAASGPVLADGNTIGMTAEEKFLVRHVPSLWDRPGDVIWLDC